MGSRKERRKSIKREVWKNEERKWGEKSLYRGGKRRRGKRGSVGRIRRVEC